MESLTNYDVFLRTVEVLLQIALVIFAALALSAWKREVRGKDSYKLARDLLRYIGQLSFTAYGKGGHTMHFIRLNDILVRRDEFYREQIASIAREEALFDEGVCGLFSHMNSRSDILLPRNVRAIIDELAFHSGTFVDTPKDQCTYLLIRGVKMPSIFNRDKNDLSGRIYRLDGRSWSVEGYFRKWEDLMIELQKLV